MTKREQIEATEALNNWFKSQQDIPAKYRVPIMLHLVAAELAVLDNCGAPMNVGIEIVINMLKHLCKEALEVSDKTK